ncbi:ETEC_3214 domain-containing protein [Arthrobacter sp. SW1]|uniref:ETEC_3214 domain-containing protein n=1 Tax=Arthrobacter sp. SW1 TaxID=1920889 RepID=UPI0011130B65|nr:ETEC_3214 domain-containing protein [Arthrobacter sp. SW1]
MAMRKKTRQVHVRKEELSKSTLAKEQRFPKWEMRTFGNWAYRMFLGVGAVITAWVTIAAFFPSAQKNLFPNDYWYGILKELHAGFSDDIFREKLGTPAIISEVSSAPKLTQRIYLQEKFAVMTVSNQDGNVNIYSVLACAEDFKPTFSTPSSTTVRIQDRPLNRLEMAANWQPSNERELVYVPGRTVSSLDQLIEIGAGNGNNAVRNRHYFVGVNQGCGRPKMPDWVSWNEVAYSGPSSEATESVRAIRASTPANFYAESLGLDISVEKEWGHLLLPGRSHETKDAYKLTISPHHFLLPADFLARGRLAMQR